MTAAKYLIGDVFDVMATLEDGSVDLVLTSPPFLALRSYLPADHPFKDLEIGSEPTPAEFLDTLLALTAEWGRLLAPHGSIAVELGDTYAGGGGWTGDDPKHKNRTQENSGSTERGGKRHLLASGGWPLDKSLCIIPELYAACLAYGRNVLTGEPSPAGQWRVRNLVRWVRPNPPVGALGDKFRPATSVMTVACQARDRWFDLDDVRTERDVPEVRRSPRERREPGRQGQMAPMSNEGNLAGAPPLDWWSIPTEPYSGSHYATWPRKLCERPIRSMCPREVCRVCGEPRRRIVERGEAEGRPVTTKQPGDAVHKQTVQATTGKHLAYADVTTIGWTDCGHDDYRPGIVLDPFAGSGTTGAVATGLGRDFIGIDLDERNAELATERIGPLLLEVIDTREGAA